MDELIVRTLGEQPYLETWEAMKAYTASRDASTPDEIWLLEHPRVYTQGQAGKAEHILAPGDIPVIQVDRGGQVTYHGPGQLVVYLMIDLTRRELGVRTLVDVIERSIVKTLAGFGITASPRPDAPGVYVDDAKIASLGLRVKRGCSFHGLALNVSMDMEPFRRINPCGYAGLSMCQMRDFVPGVDIGDVASALSRELGASLAHGSICEIAQR
ncbi:lipoyl(octanoyl) transferase LipB [Marinobacter orientalis]|uniref:Octanoyltransferase n=1 Tax=Marinobacter orientalis TaxID=1928859 RepID=A0A7Y0WSN4_9GAMM|nr:lipoyl(octanoyl) transferase LipB [Marinobacter orientalis]NMT64074.1 lipoyl(octanoyl) transferase LipB [Marinobacter orientalis]TGX49306.1 lipoyl(octanoyl) transferase LipB [Marinobacter orientalis]